MEDASMLLCRNTARPGFGILDVIILGLIAAIFVSLVVPGISTVRQSAARTQTHNNLKHVALSVHSCNDNFRRLPPAFDKFGTLEFETSVHVHLTPYIESDTFFSDFRKSKGGGRLKMAILPYYISPSDATVYANGEGVANFPANLRVFSAKGWDTSYGEPMPPLEMLEPGPKAGLADLKDGTQNTIVFATKFATCADGGSYWAAEPSSKWAGFFGQNAASRTAHDSDATATFQLRPRRADCLISPLMAQSFQTSGLSVALADGSVRMIDPRISAETWNRAIQPNDGKELGAEWDK
jgi:hypothetical protein